MNATAYGLQWGVGMLSLVVGCLTSSVPQAILGAVFVLAAELSALRESRKP